MTDMAGPGVTGPVVLELGNERGALVVYTPERMHGVEVEVSPATQPAHRTHTVVQMREMAGRRVNAAVFAELPAGDYLLLGTRAGDSWSVTVRAGAITELDWR